MFGAWYSSMMLAFKAGEVVRLRMMKLAGGGGDARDEVHPMVTEKMGAGIEALASLIRGSTPMAVIERYREHVAANALRLNS
jgi:hypothetical protein